MDWLSKEIGEKTGIAKSLTLAINDYIVTTGRVNYYLQEKRMCRVVDLSDGKIYVKPENNNSAFKSVIFEIVQFTNICKVKKVSYSRTGFTELL